MHANIYLTMNRNQSNNRVNIQNPNTKIMKNSAFSIQHFLRFIMRLFAAIFYLPFGILPICVILGLLLILLFKLFDLSAQLPPTWKHLAHIHAVSDVQNFLKSPENQYCGVKRELVNEEKNIYKTTYTWMQKDWKGQWKFSCNEYSTSPNNIHSIYIEYTDWSGHYIVDPRDIKSNSINLRKTDP